MKKSQFKKYLHIFDKLETDSFTHNTVFEAFLSCINEKDLILSKKEFHQLLDFLIASKNIKILENGFDLSQPLYIFAKSSHDSKLEALSLFEALIQKEETRAYFKTHLNEPLSLRFIDEEFRPIILETLLFKKTDHVRIFEPKWLYEYQWILEDTEKGLNCSDCLKACYTHDLYSHQKLQYRNEGSPIVNYQHLKDMLDIFPQKGVPVDRDCSKDLQVFFKDCLFNEFHHSCCICQAALPHMLIASHIKPFRDCGYLIEAMDSNNGLLLCRNHDYLFDQGYISFDEQGRLLICDELQDKKEIYQLKEDFKLDHTHMNASRKLFLEYHRHHIYKK